MAAAAIDTKPSLTLVRNLKAAPEKVYRAWTDSHALTQWFGPSDAFAIVMAQADVRVGGRFRVVMQAPDGEKHDVSGVYREVLPDQKLVFTWAWRSTPERESLVTVEFRSGRGGGTELTLTHEKFFDVQARDGHREGWAGCLDRLERFVA